MPSKPVGQSFGLLQAIDERLAMYGWLTNTGIKLVIIIDMEGRLVVQQQSGKNIAPVIGLKNSDLTPVGPDLFVVSGLLMTTARPFMRCRQRISDY